MKLYCVRLRQGVGVFMARIDARVREAGGCQYLVSFDLGMG